MNSNRQIAYNLDPHNNTSNATRTKLKKIIAEKNIRLLKECFLISASRAERILANIPDDQLNLLEDLPTITTYFLGLVKSRSLMKEDINKAIRYIPIYQLADAMNAGEEGFQRDVPTPTRSLYNDNLYSLLAEPLFNLMNGLMAIRDCLGNNKIQNLFDSFKDLTETQVSKLAWFATDIARTIKHFVVFYPKITQETFPNDVLSSNRINYYDYPVTIKQKLMDNNLVDKLTIANNALITLMLLPYERENIFSFFDSNNIYNVVRYVNEVKEVTFESIQLQLGRNRDYIVKKIKFECKIKIELAEQLLNKRFLETALNLFPDVSIAHPLNMKPNQRPAYQQAWNQNKKEFDRGLEYLLKAGKLPPMNLTQLSQFEYNDTEELNNFMKVFGPFTVTLLCPMMILLTLLLIYKTKRHANSSGSTKARLARYSKLTINAGDVENESIRLIGRSPANEHESDPEDEGERFIRRIS
jgi:hypothetical protein